MLLLILDAGVVLGDATTTMAIRGYADISISFVNTEGIRVSALQRFFAIGVLPDCIIVGDSFFTDHKKEKANIDQQARVFKFDDHIIPYIVKQAHVTLRMPFTATVKSMARVSVKLEVLE